MFKKTINNILQTKARRYMVEILPLSVKHYIINQTSKQEAHWQHRSPKTPVQIKKNICSKP